MVDMLLHLRHVPARMLTLELTETAILGSLETAGSTLAKLRDLGVRISCDDFGTGNNSLARLQQIPLSELKIDRSFVTGIVDDPRKQAIVKAIVDLGKAFRLDVVAEGIERWEEQTCVFTLGVETGQATTCANPSRPP